MNTRSKSGLFLIELTVVILVFSLASATCLNLFFHSRRIAEKSRNLSHASLVVQSVADGYKSSGGDMEKTAKLVGGEFSDGDLLLNYDINWQLMTTGTDPVFRVVLTTQTKDEGIVTAESVADGEELFSVCVRGGLDLE